MKLATFAVVTLFVCLASPVRAEEALAAESAEVAFVPDLTELNQDLIQRVRQDMRLKLAIWVPQQYWQLALDLSSVSDEDQARLLAAAKPFTVFLVAAADQEGPEELTFRSAEELASTLVLIDTAGESHRPIRWRKVHPELVQLLALLQPIFESTMGAFLEGFKVFVFPSTNGDLESVVDPLSTGRISLEVLGTPLVWRLPIGALLPDKRCPTSAELLSGGFKYCPYHGSELVEQ